MRCELTRQELLAEWLHTWPRHNGDVDLGATIFHTTPDALARRFARMRAAGIDVPYTQRRTA